MNQLLGRVRRRLRLAWTAAIGQAWAPFALAIVAALLLIGRLTSIPATAEAAEVVAGMALAALLIGAIRLRLPDLVVARAADRGLATRDAFATALELGGSDAPLAVSVRARAEGLAAGATAARAVPLRAQPPRILAASGLAVLSVVLVALPNPQVAARQRRAAEQAQLAAEGRRLQQAAQDLARQPAGSAHQRQVAAQLAAVARQLTRSASLQQGIQDVNRAAASLAGQLSPNALSQRAATKGLDRSLAVRPLTAAGTGDAAQQLAAAGAQLAALDPAARAALASRLQALALTQTAGDPQAAGDLAAASAALASGDTRAAASALQAAAGDQTAAATAAGDQAVTAGALATLAETQSGLSAAQPGSAPPGGQARGSGQGQGQGQGSGQGQGRGGGGGGGGGTNAPRANGGQGGSGTANGSGHNASVGLQTASVYDPVTSGSGPVLNAGGPDNGGGATASGQAAGPNQASAPGTPLASVLPRYDAQATQAINSGDLPPAERALVQGYFQGLANDNGG